MLSSSMGIWERIKKYFWIVPPVLVLLYIFALNYSPNTVIMGLDNASPYFNPLDIIGRVVNSNSFVYGGMIFISPIFWIIRSIGVSAGLLSYIYIYTCISLGVLGIILISKRFNKDTRLFYVSFLVSLTSLVTLWIISQPNFLFIAAYGSIPLLIFFLSSKAEKKHIIPIVLLSLLFLVTSLNLVAFVLFFLQILILTYVISSNKKKTLVKSLIWVLITVIFWMITLQIVNAVNDSNQTIFISLGEYIQRLTDNPYMENISDDLIASESKNEIIDSMRYSTGWMEMHDMGNTPIFRFYDTYMSEIFVGIGLVPFLLSIFSISRKKNDKKIIELSVILFITVLLISKYTVNIIDNIPILRDSLRWISSKLWPMYLIPISILSEVGVSKILKNINKPQKLILTIIILALITINGFPLITGTAFSESTKVQIPDEYLELDNIIEDNKTTLYLPSPQKLYFRQYEWGYYGSDFLSYVTSKNIIDSANLYEYPVLYENLIEQVDNCNLENIDTLIYDHTVKESFYQRPGCFQSCIIENMTLVESNMYFDVYEK